MSGKPKKEYVILTEDEIYNIQYMIREQRKLCGDCADFHLHYTKWSKNEYIGFYNMVIAESEGSNTFLFRMKHVLIGGRKMRTSFCKAF